MTAHTEEEFNTFIAQLLETNATLGFYTDFNKCFANANKIAIKLNQLNYLIGKEDMRIAINELWDENPKVFSVLNILIAVRDKDKKKVIDENRKIHLINSYFNSPEGVYDYIKSTGLIDILQNKKITNLLDYVFGVEVGLDTNARKNRSGAIMEDLVAKVFSSNGIEYRKEVYSTEFETVNNVLGEDTKRFDFVIQQTHKTYLIEVNFYSGGGSKLNEVARAYTELSPKINSCEGYEFVWITDGKGWEKAKNKLEEAFYAIPHIYNLTNIEQFINLVKKHL